MPGLGDHRVLGVDAALADSAARMRMHIADHDALLGVADVPELAVGEAIESMPPVRQSGRGRRGRRPA